MVNNSNVKFGGLKKSNTELRQWAIIAPNSVEKWSELKHSKITLLLNKSIITLTPDFISLY